MLPKKRPAARKKPRRLGEPRLYTLEVRLIGGPISAEFAKENRVVSRTVQMRGDQTLESLHFAIFDAFGRHEEHLYEFQFGKRPHDRNAIRYSMPEEYEHHGDEADGYADEASLDSLGLKVGLKFFYWFDFGDCWWHRIHVKAIDTELPTGTFPRVTKEVGENPPQYAP